jgi:hypothetical protein
LNRAALVGCKNQALSESFTLRKNQFSLLVKCRNNTGIGVVTGRASDMQVNEDGSKTMSSDDQKIIHRWNYESRKSTWRTENSNNVGGVLDHLKLGLDV